MENEIKIFNQEDEKSYNMKMLKEIFKNYNNKVILNFKDYYKGELKTSFVLLNQNKKIKIGGYPYGYKKTEVFYNIETKKKKGSRLVFQSINPKTKKLNKPKKSTYRDLAFIGFNETGKIRLLSLDFNDDISKINEFEKLIPFMSDIQKKQYSLICAYKETMKSVKFECKIQHYKDIRTGEIKKEINIMELKYFKKCDKNGNLINENEEKQQQEKTKKIISYDINRNANKIYNNL